MLAILHDPSHAAARRDGDTYTTNFLLHSTPLHSLVPSSLEPNRYFFFFSFFSEGMGWDGRFGCALEMGEGGSARERGQGGGYDDDDDGGCFVN